MTRPLPPGRVRPARVGTASQDLADLEFMAATRHVMGTAAARPAPSAGPAEDMTVREPSAGQDTERRRLWDAIEWVIVETVGAQMPRGRSWRPGPIVDALLDGPLRQLIAERNLARLERDIIGAARAEAELQRDEARAQVQRCRDALNATDHRGRALPGALLHAQLRRALDPQ